VFADLVEPAQGSVPSSSADRYSNFRSQR